MIWLVLVAVVFVAVGTWLVAKSTPTRLAVLALGLAGVGAYWFIGQPGMSDRPLEVRLAEIEQMIRTSPERLSEKEAIAIAERRARQQPTDPTPHMMIARMYESLAQRAQAEGMRLVQGGENIRRGATQFRLGQHGAGPRAHDTTKGARKSRPLPGHTHPALARGGLVDNTQHRAAAMHQRYQRGEERPAGDEGPRAIDGIEQPHPFGIGAISAEFLAPNAMFGEASGQKRAQLDFRAAISLGHRRGISLAIHRDARAEKRHDKAPGNIRRLLRRRDKLGRDQGSGTGLAARLRR